jgi:hypothetical protein
MVWLIIGWVGCSDYAIKPEVEDPVPPDPPPPPDILVTPDRVDLGVVCDAASSSITATNAGDGDLTVTELLVEGWVLGEVTLPAVVSPGESLAVPLSGVGDGKLTIVSDDPDTPRVEVPLSATLDEPPTIAWVTPVEGEIFPVGATTELAVTVTDDQPGAVVSWESDVDGALGTAVVGVDGRASVAWNAADHTSGPHALVASVVDACGHADAGAVTVCQNEGYVEDSVDLDSWHFEGNARWDATGGWVELTTPTSYQAGTAFQTSATVSSDDIEIEALVFLSGGTGADGLSLTALDSSRMTTFVGLTGGGLGYAGLPGFSIELDTWYNAEYSDPTPDDHLSFHLNGDQTKLQAWSAVPELEDDAWHLLSVRVIGARARVDLDGVTYIDEDIAGLTPFPAYVGFTASTGGLYNYHLVDSLTVERAVCDP